MTQLLAWYNLLFYIPLLGGLLIGAGTLLGLGGGHGHADLDVHGADAHLGATAPAHQAGGPHPGAEHAAGHSAGVLSQLSALLGLGSVPLGISLMLMLLIFGGAGTILNLLLAEPLAHSGSYAFGSLLGALLAMLVLSGRVSRLLGRVVPPIETYAIKKGDLIGCTAVLINDTDEQGGYAQARDADGNIHNITCRTYRRQDGPAPLGKGTEVLVIDFDPTSNRYTVEQSPKDPAELQKEARLRKRPRSIAERS